MNSSMDIPEGALLIYKTGERIPCAENFAERRHRAPSIAIPAVPSRAGRPRGTRRGGLLTWGNDAYGSSGPFACRLTLASNTEKRATPRRQAWNCNTGNLQAGPLQPSTTPWTCKQGIRRRRNPEIHSNSFPQRCYPAPRRIARSPPPWRAPGSPRGSRRRVPWLSVPVSRVGGSWLILSVKAACKAEYREFYKIRMRSCHLGFPAGSRQSLRCHREVLSCCNA